MAIDLSKYGISGTTEIVHNPSYDALFAEETKAELTGYEVGQVTELGAVNVMTGIYTGRSPKDKYIVMDENSKDTVWWTSEGYKNDNHPMSEDVWAQVKKLAVSELCNKRLFVVDAFCGADKDTRMAVRFIVEVAWQAHFIKNMFIQPSEEELANFEPDFVVYNASKAKVENYKELGLNSETCVAFNITSREQVIINTWYGGEMKKGMFSTGISPRKTTPRCLYINGYRDHRRRRRRLQKQRCPDQMVHTVSRALADPALLQLGKLVFATAARCHNPRSRGQGGICNRPHPCAGLRCLSRTSSI